MRRRAFVLSQNLGSFFPYKFDLHQKRINLDGSATLVEEGFFPAERVAKDFDVAD